METAMNSEAPRAAEPAEEVMPLLQRLFDNWVVLMVAGIAIMVIIYTGWGLWEILSLPPAELP
jgi:hypothetical protein